MSAMHSDKAAFLPPLTSLRFFAAFAILLLHGTTIWPLPSLLAPLALNQGVSFFFVLSGFILAHNYPVLVTNGQRISFYVSRLARIWPVHIASTILLFVLTPGMVSALFLPDGVTTAFLYTTLMHSWIPLWKHFFAFNSVSWSISTEWFFYLCFPLFILPWRRLNWTKIPVSGLLVIAVIAYANYTDAPRGHGAPGLTMHGLVYIFPPARLFEFVCGVVAAQVWQRRDADRNWSVAMSTALEVLSIVLVYFAMLYCRADEVKNAVQIFGGTAGVHWVTTNGFTPVFVLLIYVFAGSRGVIARIFSYRLFTLLGQISFSLYMTHMIVLSVFRVYPNTIATVTSHPMELYWLVSLATAYCMWRLVEEPCRRMVTAVYRDRDRRIQLRRLLVSQSIPVGSVAALVLFFAATAAMPKPEIQSFAQDELKTAEFVPGTPVVFENQYQLLGVKSRHVGEQVWVDVYWKAVDQVRLDKRIAMHVVDGDRIVAGADLVLDVAQSTVQPGTVWRMRHIFGAGVFPRFPAQIGITVYRQGSVMKLSQGNGDWDNRRYRLEIKG